MDANSMHLNKLIWSIDKRNTRRWMVDIAPVKALRNSPDSHKWSSCIIHFGILQQSSFHYHNYTDTPLNRELMRAGSSTPLSEIQTTTESKILKVKSIGLLKQSDSATWERGAIGRCSKHHRKPMRKRAEICHVHPLPKLKGRNRARAEGEPTGAGSVWHIESIWLASTNWRWKIGRKAVKVPSKRIRNGEKTMEEERLGLRDRTPLSSWRERERALWWPNGREWSSQWHSGSSGNLKSYRKRGWPCFQLISWLIN